MLRAQSREPRPGLQACPAGRVVSPNVAAFGLAALSFVISLYLPHILLTCRQRNQSFISFCCETDNSLSMRWVKFGSLGSMNHAAGRGGGWH